MNFLATFIRGGRLHYSGRAKRGMFAGKDIRFGNNVSFSKRRYDKSSSGNSNKNNALKSSLLFIERDVIGNQMHIGKLYIAKF